MPPPGLVSRLTVCYTLPHVKAAPMDLLLHTYTLREKPFEEVLAFAASNRFDGLELHQAHFDPERVEAEVPLRVAQARDAGVPVRCLDFKADLIGEDDTIRQAAAKLLHRHIRAAANCEIRMMNGFTGFLTGSNPAAFPENGSTIATEKHHSRCVDGLSPAAALAQEFGVALLLEVHMNTIHDTYAAMKRLLDAVESPALGATVDPGNSITTHRDDLAPGALGNFAPHVRHVHLKNARLTSDGYDYSVGLADGAVDIPAFLNELVEIGYTGPLSLEYVGDGDPEKALRRDVAFLRDHWNGWAGAE